MHSDKTRSLTQQVRRFRDRFAQSMDGVLGNVISPDFLARWIDEEMPPYRERIYNPFTTLVLFIEQVLGADHSCQDAVAHGVSERVTLGQSACSLNTAAYCKARGRLALGLITRLGREVGTQLCGQQPAVWRWRGREIKLVDGTTVSMPDTGTNQSRFPQSRSQKPGLGFPVARLVAIVSLSCGAVLEWATAACEGKNTGETALLWGLMPRLVRGDVVIADGYYAGYFMIARLAGLGADILMPQHHLRHTDFRRGQCLGARDHLAQWARPARPHWMDEATYATMPEALTMREVRCAGRTLITTLLDARQTSKQALVQLYALRWNVELDLRSIKTVMQMDILRCKSPEMVQKEIAAHLLAYNLVRSVMTQAAHAAHLMPRQLGFKAALQLLNAFEMTLRHCPRRHLACRRAALIVGIARCRLPHRPDRVEPRAVKRRPKQHWLLTTPRHILRARLLTIQERRRAQALS